MKEWQDKVNTVFYSAFGRTPLAQRLADIDGENRELQKSFDIKNMKEEAGDLLCSVMRLASECDWTVEELIQNTLDKIERRKEQYKSLGRKVRVALFGGSFNPPHIGHLKAAKIILNYSKIFDEVWVMPCYNSRDGKILEASGHRLAMCEFMTQYDGRIKTFDYEIRNKFQGETYHFVKKLLEEQFAKDEYEFSFVLGADVAKTLPNWPNSEYLMKMISFAVVARPGVDIKLKDAWFINTKDHVYLDVEDDGSIGTSSTEIRNKVQEGKFEELNGKILPEVLEYIKKNNLYGYKAHGNTVLGRNLNKKKPASKKVKLKPNDFASLPKEERKKLIQG